MSLYHLTTASLYDAGQADLERLTTRGDGSVISHFQSFILHTEIELAPATTLLAQEFGDEFFFNNASTVLELP